MRWLTLGDGGGGFFQFQLFFFQTFIKVQFFIFQVPAGIFTCQAFFVFEVNILVSLFSGSLSFFLVMVFGMRWLVDVQVFQLTQDGLFEWSCCNDVLTNQLGRLDQTENLVEVLVDQGLLETVFGGVDLQSFHLAGSAQDKDILAVDLGDVLGLVQGLDDPVVTVQQGVLDVVQGGVEQDTGFFPSSTLDSDGFMQGGDQFKLLVDNGDGVLGQQGQVLPIQGPRDVLDVVDLNLRKNLSLLGIVVDNSIVLQQQDTAWTTVNDILDVTVQLDRFGGDVVQVSDF
ncbi:hypothetical protein WICPIJ_005337 [Wickerhamomyces pijperi]|uniref:Uncharacterized protein n=1 Tax=Wickerhamomyces pijperi TaxID=599730 RepID=A0A9P8Q3M3_WICPI|nr:hypothetical protein WICPIJ_005337 [Wickerhamomyces pijperi]